MARLRWKRRALPAAGGCLGDGAGSRPVRSAPAAGRALRLALFAGTALVLPGLAAGAAAQAEIKFDPTPCPAFPAFREMDFSYTIGDKFGSQSELPVKVQANNWTTCPNPLDCGDYLSSTHQERPIVGNENITRVGIATRAYSFESPYDYLEYGHRVLGLPETVNGKIEWWGGTWRADIPLGGSLQEDQAFLRFHSDGSQEDDGLAAWKIRFSCRKPGVPSPTGDLVPRRRATGFLLGTNDVIFLQIPAGSEPSGATDLHQTVAIWPQDPQLAADFDLYVRCNARPTPTAFDFRGFSRTAQEFLHLRPDDCPGGNWNIAVHSFNGSGQFNIVAQSHKADAHITLEVAFDDAVTPAELAVWENLLAEGARFYFGMTEGTRIVDTFRIHTSRTSCPFFDPLACGGHYCNLCLDPRPCPTGRDCRAFTYTWPPHHMQLYSVDLRRQDTLPHELGHYDLDLPDEYVDVTTPRGTTFSSPQCGHTVMGVGFRGRGYNLCIEGDHGADRIAGPPAGDSGWRRIRRLVPDEEIWTPDNFPFNTFSFNGYPIGNIVEVP
ncbi:MAG: hypothetical protein ACJ76J_03170 [Thermoanaerobaculia bacterium]